MIGGILDTAKRLGATLKKAGACEFAGACPLCGGRDRFSINTRKEIFNCRGCGVGGDAIDLVRHVNDCSYGEALVFLGRDDFQPPKRAPAEEPKPPEDDAFVRGKIAAIVRDLVPLRGTPGEAYLRETRRIKVDAIADALERVDAIGWHSSVFFNQPDPTKPLHDLHGRSFGAIIAVMTHPVTAEPTGAISRTYVTADLQKLTKAKTLGAPRGIIRLDEDASVTYGLGIGEGIETTLSVMARGFRPCWSTGDKALMAAFPALSVIQRLTLFADHDRDGGGLKAAQEAQARWLAAGRKARVRMTPELGDLNDLREDEGAP
jgi:phage/plasmid primase-like uncharacterized protein